MNPKPASQALALLGVAAVALAACSGGSAASPTPKTTAVNVTLSEWAIGESVPTAPAGQVKFSVTNQGPADVHEFVIVKTDLSLVSLPTDSTGTVNEDAPGLEPVDEIEDVAVGATEDLEVTLQPGSYVLICNIYDDATQQAHYQMGMRNSFTVTP